MARKRINLLRKDECQPLTNEQMTDIKSQFHPSNTANVNIVPYHIYSTTERKIGETENGDDFYEKVMILTTPSTKNTWASIATIDDCADVYSITQNRVSINISGTVYRLFDSSVLFRVILDDSTHVATLQAYTASDTYVNKSLRIVVKYTKAS